MHCMIAASREMSDEPLFILKYGIAYVKMEREVDGKIESTDQKHIMRYQQLFASLAIRQKVSEGVNQVWYGIRKVVVRLHCHII